MAEAFLRGVKGGEGIDISDPLSFDNRSAGGTPVDPSNYKLVIYSWVYQEMYNYSSYWFGYYTNGVWTQISAYNFTGPNLDNWDRIIIPDLTNNNQVSIICFK